MTVAMVQSNVAGPDQCAQEYVAIGGRTITFDRIVNEAFFAPSKIAELNETFKNWKPFPYLIFEDLFSPILLDLMYLDFNRLRPDELRIYNTMDEKKISTLAFTRLGRASELYFQTVHSAQFIDFLEQITGIEGLIADPGLSNGGLHEIPTGGKFSIHVDFNRHATTKLDNRLVFITYLNKDWLPEYGGALELWSTDEERCEVEICPVFGRSILFGQSSRVCTAIPSRWTHRTVGHADRRPPIIIPMAAQTVKARAPTQQLF